MTPPRPRCWLDYSRLVVGVESKIGSVTRNMKPVAEKTQSTAGEATSDSLRLGDRPFKF
jgi:hypothetical protein